MNVWGLLFLIIAQFLAGRGILGIINIRLRLLASISISMLIGVAVFSLVPMVIELFHIPITKTNIIISLSVVALILAIIPARRYDLSIFKNRKVAFPRLYELLFIAFLAILMIPSLWQCYYYPPYARDVLSGPEAIAEYAIKEHKISNSVFTVNILESKPNLLKPPFITDLQIIYKLLVHPFGQLWLSVIVVSFLVWLYVLLRERLHPLLAGIFLLLFITIPEVYGYSYIILWDYSNMVYFFAGFYFLCQYFNTDKYNQFILSCLMFGFATFIRLETIVFMGLISPLFLLHAWQRKIKLMRLIFSGFLFFVIPYLFYFIWINVFVKYYLPIGINIGEEINLSPETSYFGWISKINAELIFGGMSMALYGMSIYLFIAVLLIDAIFFRTFSKETKYWLFGVAIIYLGLPLLTYLTPYFNITTAKRGLFKIFPLVILYMRDSAVMTRLSNAIKKFEYPAITKSTKEHIPQPVKQPGNTVKRTKKGK